MNLLETLITNYDVSDIIHQTIIATLLLLLVSRERVKIRWKASSASHIR